MKLARALPPWLWLILVALYFISPVDIFPDFLGLPGRVDDFLVALVGLYYMYSHSSRRQRRAGPGTGAGRARSPREPGGAEEKDAGSGEASGSGGGPPDPYAVLGVSREASFPEIRRRYRQRLLEIHPDRVQHLGPEFREMAERKTLELNEAYRRVRAEREAEG